MEEQNEAVEVEYVEPIMEVESEEEDGEVLAVSDNYKDLEQDVVYVDPDTGETIDPNNLSPFGKIKFIANQLGQTLDEPKKNCKHCYGRGYVAVDAITHLPTPCSCIYTTYRKTNPSFQNSQQPKTNRAARRQYQKRVQKMMTTMKPMYEKEEEIKAKSKAGLGKFTPGYVAKEFRVSDVENVTIDLEESVEEKEPIQIETAEGVIGKGE